MVSFLNCTTDLSSSNFSYWASLVTVNGIRRGFYYSAILVLRPPTICINVAKSVMPSKCKCSSNILVMFGWFKLTKRGDRRQDWWKTKFNSWSVCCVFVWRHHFLLDTKLPRCTSSMCIVLKTPQNVCKSTWWRENDIMISLFTGKMRLLKSFK